MGDGGIFCELILCNLVCCPAYVCSASSAAFHSKRVRCKAAYHFSCSTASSGPNPSGLLIMPSTFPSMLCLYSPYNLRRSDGGGRAEPVRGIRFTVFSAWTNTLSAGREGQSVSNSVCPSQMMLSELAHRV